MRLPTSSTTSNARLEVPDANPPVRTPPTPVAGGDRVLLTPGPRIAFRRVSSASLPPVARIVDRPASEALFLEHLPRIEKTIGVLSRRQGFRDAEAADLASWIKLRLIEDDYAIFRKFRGESAITTYLTVVIATLIQDYKIQRWGRWRPSAAALRKGTVAVRLEALVYRHGYQLAEAGELLRSRGETDLNDRELAALLTEFPRRGPPRPREVGSEAVEASAGQSTAEDIVEEGEAARERQTVETALRAAMDNLAPEDRCVLTLRFWQDMSIADVARVLNVPQKPLYRKLERAFGELRQELIKRGISSERTRIFIRELEQ